MFIISLINLVIFLIPKVDVPIVCWFPKGTSAVQLVDGQILSLILFHLLTLGLGATIGDIKLTLGLGATIGNIKFKTLNLDYFLLLHF